MSHGTKIVVSGLREGIERGLSPNLLAEYFSGRFGSNLRDGVKITVVDQATAEGRKTQGGRLVTVQVPAYKGRCLIDRSVKTTHGKMCFRVQLFYTPVSTRAVSPKLRRKGSDLRPLNELPEPLFKESPWTRLDGFVEVPDEMRMDTSKTVPLQGRDYLHWVATLKTLGRELEDLIEEEERKARERTASHLGTQIAGAVLNAMSRVDLFASQPIGILPRASAKRKTRRKATTKIRKLSEVVVLDENDQRITGCSIQLLDKRGQQIDLRETSADGYTCFGRLSPGAYMYRLAQIPPDCVYDGPSEHSFHLTHEEPACRHVFHVRSGRPAKKPARKLDRRFQVWVHEFDDADPYKTLFRHRLPALIEINEANPLVAAALESNNWASLDSLVAFCCSAALAAWTLEGHDMDFIMQAQGRLFAAICESLAEMHKGKRKI